MTTRFPMFITTFINILTTSVTHHGWMHRLLHKVQQCSFYGQWQYFVLRLCYVILLCHSTLENTIILFKKKRKKKDPFFVWFLFWYLNYFRQRVSMYAKTHAHKPIILACHVKRKVHSDIVSLRNFPFQYILQVAKIEIKQVKFRLVLRT